MKHSFLIAETPRAGPFGHRFIFPPGKNLTAGDIENVFQRALQAGSNQYIYAQQQVEQRLPNGSVREGPETLLISGLHPSDLDPTSLQKVHDTLAHRLTQLDHLVSKKINWDQEGNNTIILRKELDDWWEEDIKKILFKHPPNKFSPFQPYFVSTVLGILLGLVCGIATLYYFM